MVCKNCGADLKPGIKYCLNCGYYIDDSESVEDDYVEDSNNSNTDDVMDYNDADSYDSASSMNYEQDSYDYEEPSAPSRKKKRKSLGVTDIIIYTVLVLIIIVSVVVIIINPGAIPSRIVQQEENEEVIEPSTVEMSNYTVTFPGELYYGVENEILKISDKENYFFSYTLLKSAYSKYMTDSTLFAKDIEKMKYVFSSSEKRTVNSREFVIYSIQNPEGTNMFYYFTKADDSHIVGGFIYNIGGEWSLCLEVISDLCDSIDYSSGKNTTNNGDSVEEVMNDSLTANQNSLKKSNNKKKKK